MAKQVWAEGDILYATGSTGINENIFQYIGSNYTTDDVTSTASETTFANKTIVIPSTVKKRIIVIASVAYMHNNGSINGNSNTIINLKIGSAGAEVTKSTLTLNTFTLTTPSGGYTYGASPSCGTILFVDETTDFSSGTKQVIITATNSINSSGCKATCFNIVVLGA